MFFIRFYILANKKEFLSEGGKQESNSAKKRFFVDFVVHSILRRQLQQKLNGAGQQVDRSGQFLTIFGIHGWGSNGSERSLGLRCFTDGLGHAMLCNGSKRRASLGRARLFSVSSSFLGREKWLGWASVFNCPNNFDIFALRFCGGAAVAAEAAVAVGPHLIGRPLFGIRWFGFQGFSTSFGPFLETTLL